MDTQITVIEGIADGLDRAWRTKTPITPIAESNGISDSKIAYAIQAQLSNSEGTI